MEQRKFSLDGWQWRKYKTRDGKNAKVVMVTEEKFLPILVIITQIYKTTDQKSYYLKRYEKDGRISSILDAADDLFDVPNQKEPKQGYVYFGHDGTLNIPVVISGDDKGYERHYKNRIKIYLEENRWDD